MLAVKGRYDGTAVILDKSPVHHKCDVIVTFLDPHDEKPVDDGSLEFLFRDYIDDGVREPLVDFGSAMGNEKWLEAQRCQSPRSLLLHRKQMKKWRLFQSEFWNRLFFVSGFHRIQF